MIKKLLPVLLALIGLGGGVMAGHFLKPAPEPVPGDAAAPGKEAAADAHAPAGPHADPHAAEAAPPGDPLDPEPVHDPEVVWEYSKLDKQFIVPVMSETKVKSLIVLSISLELEAGKSAEIPAKEPKLRDAFLRVLFEHERAGGFSGAFTDERLMAELRSSLRRAAKVILGPAVNDVLVTDILRQDL